MDSTALMSAQASLSTGSSDSANRGSYSASYKTNLINQEAKNAIPSNLRKEICDLASFMQTLSNESMNMPISMHLRTALRPERTVDSPGPCTKSFI